MTSMLRMLQAATGFTLCAVVAAGCGGNSTSDGTNSGGNAGTGAKGGNAGTGAKGGSGGSTGGSGGATGGSGGATGGSGGATGGSGGSTGGSGGSTGGAGGGDAGLCGPDAKTCAQPSDCVLAEASCCICGLPVLSDYVAVNTAHANECACQGPACGCASMPNPNLTAVCTSGTCAGLDVSQSGYSACQSDTDCTLRIGLGCCEGCQSNGYDLVAVNVNETDLTKALCGDGPVGCPACAPQYPADKKAVCVANHCQVQ